MKYIFPRQFGLHNVFTSDVDPLETAQPYKDYTLREQEIKRVEADHTMKHGSQRSTMSRIPKRLRGEAEHLIVRLRKSHARCPYGLLLRYYCPHPSGNENEHPVALAQRATTDRQTLQWATPSPQVSAFCRATVSHIFPVHLWGHAEAGRANKAIIMRLVDRFVTLRRYESLTLHDALQSIQVLSSM